MKTIAVTSFKGGVCKTTTAVNLAAALSRAGHSVQGLDVDRTNVDFASFAPGLDFPVRSITAGRLAGWTQKSVADYCVVDCPPAASRETGLALRHADLVVVPVVPNLLAIRGLQRVVELLGAARDASREGSNPDLQVMVVVTMFEPGDPDARDFEEQLREGFGDAMWSRSIPRLTLLNAANNRLLSIFAHANRSEGAKIYRDLAADVAARLPLEAPSHENEFAAA